MGIFSALISGTARVAAAGTTATWNAMSGAIQGARTKRQVRDIVEHATNANFDARAVAMLPGLDKQGLALISSDPQDNDIFDYQPASPTPALDFIWGQTADLEGMVVSGGGEAERIRALSVFVDKTQAAGVPLVVIHAGNPGLAAMLASRRGNCEQVSRSGLYYDAFRGMPVDDMAYLLYETLRFDGATPAAEALLRAALEVLLLTEGTVTAENLAALSLPTLNNQIDALYQSKAISSDNYAELSRYFMSGSAETNTVRILLDKLGRQLDSVYGRMAQRSCNIKRMLNSRGAIVIDVGQANNDLLVKLLINHLLLLESQGRDFAILVDAVPVSRFPRILDALRGRHYAIGHTDVVSSLLGGERSGTDLFAELVGGVNTVVLLRHPSGATCQTWSDYLGKYHKIRVRFNVSQSRAFLNTTNTEGVQVDETDEPRVRAETLARLPAQTACVYRPDGILIAPI